MRKILYADDKKRTPALILRYYNQSWLHFILLEEITQLKPTKLTLRKLLGCIFTTLVLMLA